KAFTAPCTSGPVEVGEAGSAHSPTLLGRPSHYPAACGLAKGLRQAAGAGTFSLAGLGLLFGGARGMIIHKPCVPPPRIHFTYRRKGNEKQHKTKPGCPRVAPIRRRSRVRCPRTAGGSRRCQGGTVHVAFGRNRPSRRSCSRSWTPSVSPQVSRYI